jgi:hypothetical protein
LILPYAVLACAMALACANAAADVRNPFDPASAAPSETAAKQKSKVLRASSLPARAPMLPDELLLPPVLPPVPAARPPKHADVPRLAAETAEVPVSKKPKESILRATAASCKLKPRVESVAAPAYGGIVTVALLGSGRDCVSAVMVEEPWLEAQELSDPSLIRLAVDANSSGVPRQSKIVIANAGQSVTVTLVQESRPDRVR